MPLSIVPPAEPDPAEQVRARLRARPLPPGMCQCNTCGGREVMTITSGVVIVNGKKSGGTVIHKDICPHCWKRGSTVSMLPELKPI